jgi:probable rRNA maturation factor
MNDKSINLSVYFEDQTNKLDSQDNLDISIFEEVCLNFLVEKLKLDCEENQILNLNIMLVDETTIQQMNSEHRQKNKVTDVLSFPHQDNLRMGEFSFFAPEEELGDIIICLEVCKEQAADHSLRFDEEFLHLAVHGFLHICGYDHEISEAEEKLMEKLEEKLLLQIKEKRGRN